MHNAFPASGGEGYDEAISLHHGMTLQFLHVIMLLFVFEQHEGHWCNPALSSFKSAVVCLHSKDWVEGSCLLKQFFKISVFNPFHVHYLAVHMLRSKRAADCSGCILSASTNVCVSINVSTTVLSAF